MKRLNDQRGFTLAEMAVSLGLLAVTLATFMQLSRTAQQMSLHHAYKTQALSIGEQVTEEVLMTQKNATAMSVGTHVRTFDRKGLEVPSSNAFFSVSWSVAPSTTLPGILDIRFTVSWHEPGELETVSWATYRG